MRTEEEKAHSRIRTEMHAAFESNEIFSVSEETLQKYLASLCTERVTNEEVRHREIIKALTINHIQMQRYIVNLNKRNSRLQLIIISLTVLIFFTAGYQIYTQKQQVPVPVSKERLNNPSTSLGTKESISKTSTNPLPYIGQSPTSKNTSQQVKSLPIDSETITSQPPIKDETKQKHEQTYNNTNSADTKSLAAD